MPSLPSPSTTHYRGLAVLWTVGIVVACTLPTGAVSSVQPVIGGDKLVHFGLFAGFGALWMRGLCPPLIGPARLRRRAGLLLVGGSLFAVGSEALQRLLPIRRMADPYDAAADGLGLLVGVLAYGAYAAWIRQSSPADAGPPSGDEKKTSTVPHQATTPSEDPQPSAQNAG